MVYFYGDTLVLLLLNSCGEKKEDGLKFYGNVDVRTVSLGFSSVRKNREHTHLMRDRRYKKGDVLATLDSAPLQSLSETE